MPNDILGHMDRLLSSATAQGREPDHFLVREEDWAVIAEVHGGNLMPNEDHVSASAYKGIPVQFAALTDPQLVGLIDRLGHSVE